jgi:transcription termination factor Rho
MSKFSEKELKIWKYCEGRWNFYKQKDNGYYPSKHDIVVLTEVADKFNMSIKEIESVFNKVSYDKAQEQIKGMTKEEIKNELEKIARNNKETPWGKGLDTK